MGESKDQTLVMPRAWSDADFRVLQLEHGILLRTLARLQNQISHLISETHGNPIAPKSTQSDA
jgi:hypothetical protein